LPKLILTISSRERGSYRGALQHWQISEPISADWFAESDRILELLKQQLWRRRL